MPSDLNLKKSWHPKLLKNQEKVWVKEQEALSEHRKIKERQREIAEEREKKQLMELKLENDPNAKSKLEQMNKKIDWMYNDPNIASAAKDSSSDDYLLGKKRLDDLILTRKPASANALGGSLVEKSDLRLKNALSAGSGTRQKDDLTKSREDPMAKFKLEQLKRKRKKKGLK